jgi:3-deoxy-D-manno-octulosonic-acid transferase
VVAVRSLDSHATLHHHTLLVSSPLPADARRSLLVYNLFFPLVFLALLPGYLARMLRRGGFRAKFGQRLARFATEDRARLAVGDWTWVHSISVGETFLALKLARKIRELDPSRRIVLSVTTSTGFAVAEPAACEWLEVIYNPLDLRSIVNRTLDTVRPRQLIFIEAIWPNLLAEAKRRGIRTGFVPRLSPRSERRFRKVSGLVAPIFRLLDTLTVQEPADVARWQSLGVPAERIAVTGNSKFDHSSMPSPRVEEFRRLLLACGVPDNAPVLLGGSTFPGEERILAEVLCALRAEFPSLLLILVPRHVERTEQVLHDLAPLGLQVTLRSSLTGATRSTTVPPPAASVAVPDVLVVNTTGELRDWYHLASVVFIGKSLTSTGGQNPVEAAMAGKPVLFGPHMENFEPIISQWLAADAAIRINDAETLRVEIGALLRNPARCRTLNQRAVAIASAHTGATQRTVLRLLAKG